LNYSTFLTWLSYTMPIAEHGLQNTTFVGYYDMLEINKNPQPVI
jgi:hypothetical protein